MVVKAPCWYWEPKPGFLQEQPVLFLQPANYFFESYPRVLRTFFNIKVFYQKLFSKSLSNHLLGPGVKFLDLLFLFMCIYVCLHEFMCIEEAIRDHWILRNWSYNTCQLLDVMLGT